MGRHRFPRQPGRFWQQWTECSGAGEATTLRAGWHNEGQAFISLRNP